MPEYTLYWVWLTAKSGMSAGRIESLIEHFGTVKGIYDADNYENIPNIGKKEIGALMQKSTAEAQKIIERVKELDAEILTCDDENYPEKLLNISPHPYVLYVRGEMPDIDNTLTIAMVGTRNFTSYGKLVATRLSRDLTRAGAVIVSGMARGADTFAAKAALAAGGKTIAVLGSGLDVIYPPENAEIMDEIAQNGMLMTEYPPGSPAIPYHFPQRNRIIAGLSSGVIVTEAPEKSGSLITAQYAVDYNRTVFAVPGKIVDGSSAGANRLIQSGAKLVMTAEDILDDYPYMNLHITKGNQEEEIFEESVNDESEASESTAEEKSAKPESGKKKKKESADTAKKTAKKTAVKKTAAKKTVKKAAKRTEEKPKASKSSLQTDGLDEAEINIAELLNERDMTCDELVNELGMTAAEVNVKLTLLEMKRKIKKLPGGRYKINV